MITNPFAPAAAAGATLGMGGNPFAPAPPPRNPFAGIAPPVDQKGVQAADEMQRMTQTAQPAAADVQTPPESSAVPAPQGGIQTADEMMRMTQGIGAPVAPQLPPDPTEMDPDELLNAHRPIPQPAQILESVINDPQSLRQAEDAKKTLSIAMWEAFYQGDVRGFLNTQAGQMVDFTLDQLQDITRANAVKLGYEDPEVMDVLTMSNILKMGQVMSAEQQFRLGQIKKEDYNQIMGTVLPELDSMSPRQQMALRNNFLAFAPALQGLLQNAAYSQQVINSRYATDLANKQFDATQQFEKEKWADQFGITKQQFQLARAQIEEENRRWNMQFNLIALPTSKMNNELAAYQAQVNSLNAVSNVQQVLNQGLSVEQQKLLNRYQILNSIIQNKARELKTLNDANNRPGAPSGDPDYAKNQLRIGEINKEIEAYNTQMNHIQEALNSDRFDVSGNPLYTTLGKLVQGVTSYRGGGVPNANDITNMGDSTGILNNMVRPYVPQMPMPDGTLRTVSLKGPEYLDEPSVNQLYDYLSNPAVLARPDVQKLFTDPAAWQAKVQSMTTPYPGDPARTFKHANLIYLYMTEMAKHAQTTTPLPAAPPAAPAAPVKPAGGLLPPPPTPTSQPAGAVPLSEAPGTPGNETTPPRPPSKKPKRIRSQDIKLAPDLQEMVDAEDEKRKRRERKLGGQIRIKE